MTDRALDQSRPVSWAVLLLAFFAWAAAGALMQAAPVGRRAVHAVAQATGGWVNTTLLTSALTLAAVLAVVLGVGRLRMCHLGLARGGVVPGLAGAVALWLAWQASLFVAALIETGGIRIGRRWTDFDASMAIGMLLAMLFVGLSEEVWFRGVLLVQLRQKFSRLLGGRPRVGLVLALVITSLLFGAVHLWGAVGGSPVRALLFHGVNGLIFALLFLYSGNLWFVAAVHGLGNWGMGMPLFETSVAPVYVLLGLKASLVAAWAIRDRRARSAARRVAGSEAIREEDSIITTENGFRDITYLPPGTSPDSHIEMLVKGSAPADQA
jgi:membrane protease YdiL (CAAX protease family)